MYGDVETLVTQGFLSQPVRVGDTTYALRSLTPGDLLTLQARAAYGDEDEWQLWLVASAVWMAGGVLLFQAPNACVRIRQSLKAAPMSLRKLMLSVVMGLFRRQTRAFEGVEAYAYESPSRFLWRSFGKGWAGKAGGIPGAERVGTNQVQRMWFVINELEDSRNQNDSLWESAKLIASAHSPKGIKKLDQQDRQRATEEIRRRKQVQDRYYYYRMGLVDLEGKSLEGDPVQVSGPKTVADLEDEMRRWVTGDLDEHDRVVHEYKQKAIAKMQAEEQARQARLAAVRREARRREEQEQPMSTGLVAYTAEQVQALLQGRAQGQPGTRSVPSGAKGRQYLYERYLTEAPSAGNLRVSEGRLEEATELDRQLARRAVPFRTSEE
jgi:hypothetical protein